MMEENDLKALNQKISNALGGGTGPQMMRSGPRHGDHILQFTIDSRHQGTIVFSKPKDLIEGINDLGAFIREKIDSDIQIIARRRRR